MNGYHRGIACQHRPGATFAESLFLPRYGAAALTEERAFPPGVLTLVGRVASVIALRREAVFRSSFAR